jgi:hypothetical protein
MERHELRVYEKSNAKVKLANGERYDITTEKGGSVFFSFTFDIEEPRQSEKPETKSKEVPDEDPQLNLFEPIK